MAGQDTTTALNPAAAGGDSMDETLVTQSDGSTSAKRARVDIGFKGTNGKQGPLVSKDNPLPTYDATMNELLKMLIEEIRELKEVIIELGQ